MNVLITGATGLIATELIMLLLQNPEIRLTLVSRDPEKILNRYYRNQNRITALTLSELVSTKTDITYGVVIHTAFARNASGRSIAESLKYLADLCSWIRNIKVRKFINISSQSVYGNDYTPGIDEAGITSPDYMYALGKYSSELIVETSLSRTNIKIYQIRLASVVENARFIKIFVENVLHNMTINIVAPQQVVSFIDVRDVAQALSKIIFDNRNSGGIYNIGSGCWYSILHVAETVLRIAKNDYGKTIGELVIKDNGTVKSIGMSNKKFKDDFNWEPQYSLEDMISSIFEMLTNVNGGGIL